MCHRGVHGFEHAQDLILELVRKACRIPVVANDLVWNGGILSWLHGIAGRCCEENVTILITMCLFILQRKVESDGNPFVIMEDITRLQT